MSNLIIELLFALFLSFVLLFLHRKIRFTNKMIMCIYIYYWLLVLIILLSPNGSIYFTDGLDYLENATKLLQDSNYSLNSFFNIRLVISYSNSWHFIPTFEFAIFSYFFKSTKCIAIFHVMLMQISALLWYLICKTKFNEHIAKLTLFLSLFSLYLNTFTISALKDPIVYFLVTLISYLLLDINKNKKIKNIYLIIPILVILFFTRIYAGIALFLVLLIIQFITKKSNKINLNNCLKILCFFVIMLALPITRDLIEYIIYKGFQLISATDFVSFIKLLLKNIFGFYFSPFITNVFKSQNLYLGCYIESLLRLICVPIVINGIIEIKKNYKKDKELFIVLVIPFFINVISLTLGKQESPIRQYMWNYPMIIILISIGLDKFIKEVRKNEKCMCSNNSTT